MNNIPVTAEEDAAFDAMQGKTIECNSVSSSSTDNNNTSECEIDRKPLKINGQYVTERRDE